MKISEIQDTDRLIGDIVLDFLYEKYTEPVADNMNQFVVNLIPFSLPIWLRWIPWKGRLLALLDSQTPELPIKIAAQVLNKIGLETTSERRRAWPGSRT